MQQPGLKLAKVALLVGGPDWPTTVFTGILRVNVWQMVLGSTPVIVLVLPCCFSGALILKYSEGGNWQSLANVMLALAALVQAISILVAFYLIQKTYQKHRDSFATMSRDEEVDASIASYKEKARVNLYLTDWHSQTNAPPLWLRVCLMAAAVLMGMCCYTFTLLQDLCFKPFDITDKISKKLGNNVLSVVRPLGWLCFLFLLAVTILLIVYHVWLQWRIWQFQSTNEHVPNKTEAEDLCGDRDSGSRSDFAIGTATQTVNAPQFHQNELAQINASTSYKTVSPSSPESSPESPTLILSDGDLEQGSQLLQQKEPPRVLV